MKSPLAASSAAIVLLAFPLLAPAQGVAVYRGVATRAASAGAPAVTTKAVIAFSSLDPGVLDGKAGIETVGPPGSCVGRLDGRTMALVSRTEKYHLAWTGRLDSDTGKIAGAVRAIPLDGGSVEVWSYEVAPSEAADGVVTALRIPTEYTATTADAGTTRTTTVATTQGDKPVAEVAPLNLVGQWELFTFIDDLPQTRTMYIEKVTGTLFVFRLGSEQSPQETGTYDPATQQLRFLSGGSTYEGTLSRNRRGEWEFKGPMRHGTSAQPEATDSRGSLRAKRLGDLPAAAKN